MISVEQNLPKQLAHLAAQRSLYSAAKRVFIAQVLLGGPFAVATALLARFFPSTEAFVAFWGFLVVLVDLLWLDPWLSRRREDAALIQESFDCKVLEMPWNEIKAGDRPDPELIKEYSDRYDRVASKMPPLTDWYAPIVDSLPIHIGRLVCQRSNCAWDAKLRRRYAFIVLAALAVVALLILSISFQQNYTLQDFLMKVISPLAPALGLAYRQFTDQREAARRLEELKSHCIAVWNDALDNGNERSIAERSRALQDEILESRRTSPLVFDSVFRWLRQSFENQMAYSADDLVAEARRRLA